MSDVVERVRRGAALLDERLPGWRQEIAKHALDMSACHLCVLGQLFGGYTEGRLALELDPLEAEELGFEAPDRALGESGTYYEYYRALRDTWIREVCVIGEPLRRGSTRRTASRKAIFGNEEER